MNIRIVRQKIKSINNVKKITKAMQLVSAVKMKKAQQTALEGKVYQETLERVLAKLMTKIDTNLSPLITQPEIDSDKTLEILISSNKGLCGSFNVNLFRYLLMQNNFKKNDFIVIGHKGAMFLNRLGVNIVADFSVQKPRSSISAIVSLAFAGFLEGKYNKVVVYYNKFISSLRTEPTVEILLPFKELKFEQIEKIDEYIVEPDPEEMIDALIRSYIEDKLRYILIQSEAGEHSARMLAMKNATDNSTDLIYNLTMLRNKLRQEKITYELLDMVTAQQSVEIN